MASDIFSLLAGISPGGPNTSPYNPTSGGALGGMAQSPAGLFTPGGASAFDGMIGAANQGPGAGIMGVGLGQAVNQGVPFSAGFGGAGGGGALVPYSAETAAAATNPLVAAMRSAGIGSAPFVLPSSGAAIPMGAAGGEGAAGVAGAAEASAPMWARMLGRLGFGVQGGAAGAEGAASSGGILAALRAGATKGNIGAGIAGSIGAQLINSNFAPSKGRQIGADAVLGAGLGPGIAGLAAAALPAEIAAGPPGWAAALAGAGVGGLYGLLHNGPKAATEVQGEHQLASLFDAARLDNTAKQDILSNFQTAWAMAQGDHAKEKGLVQSAIALVPQERQAMVDRLAQSMAMQQYLPQVQHFFGPLVHNMTQDAQNTYDLANADAQQVGGARGHYLSATARSQLENVQNQAHSYQLAAAFYPILSQLALSAQKANQTKTSSSSSGGTNYAAAIAQALNPTALAGP